MIRIIANSTEDSTEDRSLNYNPLETEKDCCLLFGETVGSERLHADQTSREFSKFSNDNSIMFAMTVKLSDCCKPAKQRHGFCNRFLMQCLTS